MDRPPVHELSAVNCHSLRFKCRATTVLCKARGYIGSTQGTLRYDLISTNRPDSIAAFPRENTMIGAADMPCHWPPFWIYSPRHFPKWAEPEIFGLQSVEESGLAVNFIRKLPRPILKTEIVRRTQSAYWVVSQRALCSPL